MSSFNFTLPDGFEIKSFRYEQAYISNPLYGGVTIYWKIRKFSLGGDWNKLVESEYRTGRGWKQKLVDDAINYLMAIHNE